MKTIALSAIVVSKTRQRRTFDAARLHKFKEEILKEGLFNPITLRVEGEQYVLVAGERRLRVVTDCADLDQSIRHDGQEVPLGFIPYTLLQDLDPLEAEEAELSENINREDLSWQERAAAHARIAALRAAQSAAAGTPTPTIAELSVEVRDSDSGSAQATTRRELAVARHLDDPDIKAAKTVDEAFKILQRKEASSKAAALGEKVGKTFTAEAHAVYNEDALLWLSRCQEGRFDCILTDPPYGMGADEFGDSGGMAAGGHSYVDSIELATRAYETLAVEGFRVAKQQAHLYAFCDIDLFPFLKKTFAAAGWAVFRTPLIWYKRTAFRAPWPESGPQRKYECILYAKKGDRPALKLSSDVLDFSSDSNLGHMAQKPVALFKELLSRTCGAGEAVLDPFCGSGPIFPAAHELKVRATGIELDQSSYGLAVKRIEQLKSQQELVL